MVICIPNHVCNSLDVRYTVCFYNYTFHDEMTLVHVVTLVLESACIATDNACKLVINLIFNTIIYRIVVLTWPGPRPH